MSETILGKNLFTVYFETYFFGMARVSYAKV